MFFVTLYYQKESEIIAEKTQRFDFHLTGYVRELLNKYKTLLLFGNLDYERTFFKNMIKKYHESIINSSFWKNFILNSLSFLYLSVNGIIVIFGAYLIKDSIEKNQEINGIMENIFTFQTGHIMSFITCVFAFDFFFRDIFNFLKVMEESFKAAQNYYDLEIYDKQRIQEMENERNIEIYHLKKKEIFDIENFEIEELNFVDVSFDYKCLLGNNKKEFQEEQVKIINLDFDKCNDSYKNNYLKDINNNDADLKNKYDTKHFHNNTKHFDKIGSHNTGNDIIIMNGKKNDENDDNESCSEDIEDIFVSPKKHLKDNLDIPKLKRLLSPSRRKSLRRKSIMKAGAFVQSALRRKSIINEGAIEQFLRRNSIINEGAIVDSASRRKSIINEGATEQFLRRNSIINEGAIGAIDLALRRNSIIKEGAMVDPASRRKSIINEGAIEQFLRRNSIINEGAIGAIDLAIRRNKEGAILDSAIRRKSTINEGALEEAIGRKSITKKASIVPSRRKSIMKKKKSIKKTENFNNNQIDTQQIILSPEKKNADLNPKSKEVTKIIELKPILQRKQTKNEPFSTENKISMYNKNFSEGVQDNLLSNEIVEMKNNKVDDDSNRSQEVDFIVSFDENLDNKNQNKNFKLEKMSVTFSKEKINYLIGKSGSGKTSILSLILKLFKPTAGKIMLNNTFNINNLSDEEYSSLISYVPQESIFYDMSIKDNIRFFQDEIKDEKIFEIVKFLKMGEYFMNKLKMGIETKIGPNGSEISGGQRQLISIARALVKSPKILLLDEFTSNFDNILTNEIFKILNHLSKKTIIIIVTHHVRNIDFKDNRNQIFFIEKGKIKEKNLLKIQKNFEKNQNFDINISNTSSEQSHSINSRLNDSINQKMNIDDGFKLDDIIEADENSELKQSIDRNRKHPKEKFELDLLNKTKEKQLQNSKFKNQISEENLCKDMEENKKHGHINVKGNFFNAREILDTGNILLENTETVRNLESEKIRPEMKMETETERGLIGKNCKY